MYDIAILGSDARGPSLLDFNDRLVTGGLKLVQQVLILLFTDEDEPLSYGAGTQLPEYLAGANVYDEAVINNQFAIAAAKVQDFLQQTQPVTLPLSERLLRVDTKVSRIVGSSDQAQVELVVVSQDETATTVEVPITLLEVP
jgi:hypothetical protein